MLKFIVTWAMTLTFWATSVLAEGEAIKIFQLDFDLSPTSAKTVAETRFECTMDYDDECVKSGTPLVELSDTAGKLSGIEIRCVAFEGCSYSTREVVSSLSEQKSLIFSEAASGSWCAIGTLGEKICVDDFQNIVMYRAKFRVPSLSFD